MRLLVHAGIVDVRVLMRIWLLFSLCHSKEVYVDPHIIFTDVVEAAEGFFRPADVRISCVSIVEEYLRWITAKLSRQINRLFEELGKQGVVGRLIQS